MKMILMKLVEMLNYNVRKIPRKYILSHSELLVYFTSTYIVLNPHLKGLHITVDLWIPYQDI